MIGHVALVVLIAAAAALPATCANPSYQIKVLNESAFATLVRVSADDINGDVVYDVPPGEILITTTASGIFNGRVELLAKDCAVVEYVDMADLTSPVLVTFVGDGHPSADINDLHEGMPEAAEVGNCVRR